MTDDKFGELRSLLQQAPSKKSWSKVLAWCEANATMLEREDVATYLDDMLKAWPAKIERFISVPLLDLLLKQPDAAHPWLAQTSGLAISKNDLNDDAGQARLESLSTWGCAPYIEELRLGKKDDGDYGYVIIDAACAFSDSAQWRGLKRLHVQTWLDDESMLNLGGLNFPSLEVLSLEGSSMQFSPDGVDEFRKGTHLPPAILEMKLHPERIYWDSEMDCWE